jgi:peptidoglycan hydrolase-like protein with peptidoglycan-binding domain
VTTTQTATKLATQTTTTTKVDTTSSATFTRPLTLGSVGEDVKALQVYLNDHGFIVATSGNGSPGHESTYFGPATQKALIKFQAANGITANGYFGTSTLAVMEFS